MSDLFRPIGADQLADFICRVGPAPGDCGPTVVEAAGVEEIGAYAARFERELTESQDAQFQGQFQKLSFVRAHRLGLASGFGMMTRFEGGACPRTAVEYDTATGQFPYLAVRQHRME